jgi:L-aspartate oxidase
VLIVGSGAAGLFCALKLQSQLRVLLITKKKITDCNSHLAQDGIAVVTDETDKSSFIADTLAAGQHENDIAAVNLLAERAIPVLSELGALGVPFSKTENGQFSYAKDCLHSKARIVQAGDETGRHLIETLEKHLRVRQNVTIWEDAVLLDILEYTRNGQKACAGALVQKDDKIKKVKCHQTVLACGGVGGLFRNTTNHATITGDAIAIAHHHGVEIRDLNRMQFHPTALYESDCAERRFLISGALRCEGARLLNPANEEFIEPQASRDVVTAAIRAQMKRFHSPYVYLDISARDRFFILERFPMIYKKCLSAGYEITFGPFPVSPAQHIFMGGISVDRRGRTSMAHLYAVGETSCTGAHGANCPSGNALLEALVYGAAAAEDINAVLSSAIAQDPFPRRFVTNEHLLNELYKENLLKTLLIGENAALYDELFER